MNVVSVAAMQLQCIYKRFECNSIISSMHRWNIFNSHGMWKIDCYSRNKFIHSRLLLWCNVKYVMQKTYYLSLVQVAVYEWNHIMVTTKVRGRKSAEIIIFSSSHLSDLLLMEMLLFYFFCIINSSGEICLFSNINNNKSLRHKQVLLTEDF